MTGPLLTRQYTRVARPPRAVTDATGGRDHLPNRLTHPRGAAITDTRVRFDLERTDDGTMTPA